MIKCCKWKPTGQIVVGACDPVSPSCVPGYFLTTAQLEARERAAFQAGRMVDGNVTKSWRFEEFEDYKKEKSNG